MNQNIIKKLLFVTACIAGMAFMQQPAMSGWVSQNKQRQGLTPDDGQGSSNSWTVVAEGTAPIVDGNTGDARARSLDDCYRFAIDQVLVVYMDSAATGSNGEAAKEDIYSHATDYAYVEDIMSEGKGGNNYTIKARIGVNIDKITDRLRREPGLTRRWRIMVVIPETQLLRHHIPDPAAETAIVAELLKNGYRMMDQDLASKVRYDDEILDAYTGDVHAIKHLFEESKADILVVGQAFSQSTGVREGNFVSSRARVEVKAIRRDSGEIISSVAKQLGGLDLTEELAGKAALGNAGTEAGDDLARDISRLPSSSSLPVELIIEDCPSITALGSIEDQLRKIDGVISVSRDEFDEGTAYLEVEVDNAWFDAFQMAIEKIESPAIRIIRSSKNSISAIVVPSD
jgi:hypothetical protein